jgi:protein-S-isoprenylcysteine O-methyltransferase Ste14
MQHWVVGANRLGDGLFGAIAAARKAWIIFTGPHTRMRHLRYLSLALRGIRLALLTANWLFTVCISREERMMIAEVGDEDREYARRTGRVLPEF